MYNFAQLNEESICVAVSQLSEMVDMPEMISLEKYNTALLGMKYENGNWFSIPPAPIPLSKEEIEQLEIAVNLEYLVCLADLNVA